MVRSSSAQGLSSALIRVHSWVGLPLPPRLAVLCDPHQLLARGHLVVGLDGVLEVAEQDVHGADHLRDLGGHLALLGSKKWIARLGRAGISVSGRCAHGEGAEEVLGATHARKLAARAWGGYDRCLGWDSFTAWAVKLTLMSKFHTTSMSFSTSP